MYLGGINELVLMGRQVEPSIYYYVEQQQDLGQILTQAKFAPHYLLKPVMSAVGGPNVGGVVESSTRTFKICLV